MADNTVLPYTNDIVASDDIDGVKYQRMKLIYGDDGYNYGDVSPTNPLPIINFAPTQANTLQLNASTTPVTFLMANPNRRGAVIVNNTNEPIYILFGDGHVSLTNWTIVIEKKGKLFLGNGDFMGTIKGVWSSNVGSCNITELT